MGIDLRVIQFYGRLQNREVIPGLFLNVNQSEKSLIIPTGSTA